MNLYAYNSSHPDREANESNMQVKSERICLTSSAYLGIRPYACMARLASRTSCYCYIPFLLLHPRLKISDCRPNTRPLTWTVLKTILSNDLKVKIRHACLTSSAYSGMSPEACVARPRGRGDHVPSLGFPGLASQRSMPSTCSHSRAALVLRCAAGFSLATSSAAPCRSASVKLYKGEGINRVLLYSRDRP